MVTRLGDMIILDNLKLGVSKDETDDSRVYLGFTDIDNQRTYLIPIKKMRVDEYFQLVKSEIAKMDISIAGANDMPGGG
jgi:hypothetical protein